MPRAELRRTQDKQDCVLVQQAGHWSQSLDGHLGFYSASLLRGLQTILRLPSGSATAAVLTCPSGSALN